MNKITVYKGNGPEAISMPEMPPLSIGVVVGGSYDGQVVMRTANSTDVEVINLSVPGKNKYWGALSGSANRVRLMPNATITVHLNE
jgi:hypothetical protein